MLEVNDYQWARRNGVSDTSENLRQTCNGILNWIYNACLTTPIRRHGRPAYKIANDTLRPG